MIWNMLYLNTQFSNITTLVCEQIHDKTTCLYYILDTKIEYELSMLRSVYFLLSFLFIVAADIYNL